MKVKKVSNQQKKTHIKNDLKEWSGLDFGDPDETTKHLSILRCYKVCKTRCTKENLGMENNTPKGILGSVCESSTAKTFKTE